MANSKHGATLSQTEINYILKAKDQGVPNKVIADTIGRSVRVVQKYYSLYQQKNNAAKTAMEKLPDKETLTHTLPFRERKQQNTIERLKELRNLLREQMLVADPRNISAISKEYRAAVTQIAELEGADATDVVETKHDDAIAQALKFVVGA
nr:MAG TPA: hypothetical protein [Caudoviricetes sp.]